jgi:glyoxylase-like metal-dependent hydrolase (beta-lactamase superfamily II)
MKRLHRSDLFGWSQFQEHLDIDFNSVAWTAPGGSIVFDPLPMSTHDLEHLRKLGPVAWIVITNSRHIRGAVALREATSAKLAAPDGERATFPLPADRFLTGGDELVPGLMTLTVEGSKTAGELAFVLGDTLITGDLVRSHRAGCLQMLKPEQGMSDIQAARRSIEKLAELDVDAVLVGDGFSVFRDGQRYLRELAGTI